MANKISSGTIINVGTIIAGVDADNPPFATTYTSSSDAVAAGKGNEIVSFSEGGTVTQAYMDNEGWILYTSFSSDNTLDSTTGTAWNGNNVLMSDLATYGYATSGNEYYDGVNIEGSGNAYGRPSDSIVFWKTGGEHGSLYIVPGSWNGPSNVSEVKVEWSGVAPYDTVVKATINGTQFTDQPAISTFDPNGATPILNVTEEGIGVASIKNIWFRLGNYTDSNSNTVEFSQDDNDQQYDVINEFVTLTRGAEAGLYNSVHEFESDTDDGSPIGTVWSLLKSDAPSDYDRDLDTIHSSVVGWNSWYGVYDEEYIGNKILTPEYNPVIMHCLQSGEFYEFTFTQWTKGGGGGMAYTRRKLDLVAPEEERMPFYLYKIDKIADPTSATWRANYAPAGYKWLSRVGFTSIEPLRHTDHMFFDYDTGTGTLDYADVTNLDMSEVVTAVEMFRGCTFSGNSSDLTNWNVSKIRDFHEMFRSTDFNQDIGGWTIIADASTPIDQVVNSNYVNPLVLLEGDTTNFESYSNTIADIDADLANVNGVGVSMQGMFEDNEDFDQDIGSWDVSQVFCFDQMFDDAKGFNNGGSASINNWNTSNGRDFYNMFKDAESFNQPIDNWNMSNATQLQQMFREAISFNQDLNSWNTSQALDMRSMFSYANFNGQIGNWNVSNVKYFDEMFEENSSFNQYIGDWNTSGATSMDEMFQDATAFNQDISGWNVSNVTDFGEMFENAESFNQDLSSWVVAQSEEHGQFDKGCDSWTLPRPNFPGGISSSDD